MGAKGEQFQISQQLHVFSGRIKRAERDQQAAIAALQKAQQNEQAAHQRRVQIEMQVNEAEREFAAHAASEQTRIWRDTTNRHQAEAAYDLEQCKLLINTAEDELKITNRALQKLQLQNNLILQLQLTLSKEKLKRREAMAEDDLNASNTLRPIMP